MSFELLHERMIAEQAPITLMNLVLAAQSSCVLNVAFGLFTQAVAKANAVYCTAFFVASGDDDDDDDIQLW